jgi:hypothetical protein
VRVYRDSTQGWDVNRAVEPAVTTTKIGSADFPTEIDVLTPFALSRSFDEGAGMKSRRLEFIGSAIISTTLLNGSASPPARPPSSQVSAVGVSLRDGSHDFDFLIGNWKAHVRVLRNRLNGSNDWVEYNGISNHKKLLDSNANFEEFDAFSDQLHKRNKGQTLRLYNPEPTNGRSICWTSTRERSTCPQLSDNLLKTAESSTIKTPTKVEPSTCAMYG